MVLGFFEPLFNSAAVVLLALVVVYLAARLRTVRAMLHTQIEINGAMAARLEKIEREKSFVAGRVADLERERGMTMGPDFEPLQSG